MSNYSIIAEALIFDPAKKDHIKYTYDRNSFNKLMEMIRADQNLKNKIIEHYCKKQNLIMNGATSSTGVHPAFMDISALILEFDQSIKNALLADIIYHVEWVLISEAND